MDTSLKTELEQMRKADQEHRKAMWGVAQEHGNDSAPFQELMNKQKEIDAKNIKRLLEIIEERGWPGISQVSEKASGGAFLVLQHAALSYQKKYLPLLREAKAAGELKGSALALLEDRILMREEKKQMYGSQLRNNQDGKPELWPIEDEANVDQRRAEVGLEPLVDYMKRFGLEYVAKSD